MHESKLIKLSTSCVVVIHSYVSEVVKQQNRLGQDNPCAWPLAVVFRLSFEGALKAEGSGQGKGG